MNKMSDLVDRNTVRGCCDGRPDRLFPNDPNLTCDHVTK